MLKLKHRKILFWILLALLAGGSMATYSELEMNFFLKTAGLVLFQQIATVLIFFGCFGSDLIRSGKLR